MAAFKPLFRRRCLGGNLSAHPKIKKKKANITMTEVKDFEVCGNHQEIGRAIGQQFSDSIHSFFDNYDLLQKELLPYYHTSPGREYYEAFLKLHRAYFPEYMSELEGMSQGASLPFEEIFLANLRGEFSGLLQLESHPVDRADKGYKGCTDCLVLNPDRALIGHNEDGSPASSGKMFVVHITSDNGIRVSALCYPGFLPGNAFGYNEAGILHTVNHVAPRQVRLGFGRHFIARSLLDARTMEDCIQRVATPGQAAGFNFNIGSLRERRIVGVEVSPERHHVHEVNNYYLHTNHYIELNDVEQEITPSSRIRLSRARTLCRNTPPTDETDVLALLNDQTDQDYPIYCESQPPEINMTLCTALFDLDNRQLNIYWSRPVINSEKCTSFSL
jgi:predicted choloylglycine hydrolase